MHAKPPPPNSDRWNTIYYSELGASAAVLDAGLNIGCLLARYQGVDWRDRANWGCNAGCAQRAGKGERERGGAACIVYVCVLCVVYVCVLCVVLLCSTQTPSRHSTLT